MIWFCATGEKSNLLFIQYVCFSKEIQYSFLVDRTNQFICGTAYTSTTISIWAGLVPIFIN